ncbi:hypothetical protein ACLMJK_004823 [Lecanora helva]
MLHSANSRVWFSLIIALITFVSHISAAQLLRAPLEEPTSTRNEISKRDDDSLAAMWTAIPNKVPVGGGKLFKYTDKQQSYSTVEFYGCTVVIVVDGKQTYIGHFNQQSGDCADVLTKSAVTKSSILNKIDNVMDTDEFQNTAKAWIIASTPNAKNAPGYKDLVQHLGTYEVKESNVHLVQYPASSGIGEHPGIAKGKAVVARTKKSDGKSTVKVYIEHDHPTRTLNYNAKGNPTKKKRDSRPRAVAPSIS